MRHQLSQHKQPSKKTLPLVRFYCPMVGNGVTSRPCWSQVVSPGLHAGPRPV
uniref:Uncharacterized protein n=1 Tax=Falco tinnunculus TaxID=100819 RepID=A0A8C4XQW5_FALTI